MSRVKVLKLQTADKNRFKLVLLIKVILMSTVLTWSIDKLHCKNDVIKITCNIPTILIQLWSRFNDNQIFESSVLNFKVL